MVVTITIYLYKCHGTGLQLFMTDSNRLVYPIYLPLSPTFPVGGFALTFTKNSYRLTLD
ncbi:hypothetical protein [Sporosarcina thermotolerans]|uniref:hypothetical protein n=1 Tax=Sporosarcina thermotolerans TaxID=633404 RepID=UPI0036D259AC